MPKFTPGEFALVKNAFGISRQARGLVKRYEGEIVQIERFMGHIETYEGEDWYFVLGDNEKFYAREVCLNKLPGEFTPADSAEMSKIFKPKKMLIHV